MSTLMMSDLLAELSPEQQQLLAGGANGDDDTDTETEDNGSENGESSSMFGKGSGVYLVRSRSIVRVRKLEKS
jgi:hypothetical protein